jgi:non-homologous end joining protein Ku
VIQKVMVKEGHPLAQVVLRDREQTVLLRPLGKVLAMTFLNYAEAVKDPAQQHLRHAGRDLSGGKGNGQPSSSRRMPS